MKEFIEKYGITKIHVYGLIPQKGTMFEEASRPTKEEQAWWIAQLRITFPKLDIQCGIWDDRIDYIPILLRAGSNSISKFKATKLFGTQIARDVEGACREAGREFVGTLTEVPNVDWDAEVNRLNIDDSMKKDIREKLELYLVKMRKNVLKCEM